MKTKTDYYSIYLQQIQEAIIEERKEALRVLNKEWMTICTLGSLTETNLKWAKHFVPDLRTRKNPYEYTEDYLIHTVYCIINLVNSKFYIGKHTFWYDPSKYRVTQYKGSNRNKTGNRHLENSILKYGINNFRMLILKYFKTEEEAYLYEKKLITSEMINSVYCYNLQGGGKGFASGSGNYIHTAIRLGEHPTKLLDENGLTLAQRMVKEGRHAWLKDSFGNSVSKRNINRRISEGTFISPFKLRPDGTSVQQDLVKQNRHCLQKRPDGTSVTSDRYARGEHPFLGVRGWNSPRSTENSRFCWALAKLIYKVYARYPEFKGMKDRLKESRVRRTLDDIDNITIEAAKHLQDSYTKTCQEIKARLIQ